MLNMVTLSGTKRQRQRGGRAAQATVINWGNNSPLCGLQRASLHPFARNPANIVQRCTSFPLLMELASCNNNLNFTPRRFGGDKRPKNGHKLATPCLLIDEAPIQALLICRSRDVIRPCTSAARPRLSKAGGASRRYVETNNRTRLTSERWT